MLPGAAGSRIRNDICSKGEPLPWRILKAEIKPGISEHIFQYKTKG